MWRYWFEICFLIVCRGSRGVRSGGHVVETLGTKGGFSAVAGLEIFAEFRLGDVAYYVDSGNFLDFLMCMERNGEEQFIVFASVHGGCDEVHVEFLGHEGSLIVDRNAVLIYPAAYA